MSYVLQNRPPPPQFTPGLALDYYNMIITLYRSIKDHVIRVFYSSTALSNY